MSYQSNNNSKRYPNGNDRYVERAYQKERDKQYFEDKAVYDARQRSIDESQQRKLMREQQYAAERQRAADEEQQRRFMREQQEADERRRAADKALEEEKNRQRLETNRLIQEENDQRESTRRLLDQIADTQRREQEINHQKELQAAEDEHYQMMMYKQNAKSYKQYDINSKNPFYLDDDGTIISSDEAWNKWQQYACPKYHEFQFDDNWIYFKDDDESIITRKKAIHKYYHSLSIDCQKNFYNEYKRRALFHSNNKLVIQRNAEETAKFHESFVIPNFANLYTDIANEFLIVNNLEGLVNEYEKAKNNGFFDSTSKDEEDFYKVDCAVKERKLLELEKKTKGPMNSLNACMGLFAIIIFLFFLGRVMFFSESFDASVLYVTKPSIVALVIYIVCLLPTKKQQKKLEDEYYKEKYKYDTEKKEHAKKVSEDKENKEKHLKIYKKASKILGETKELISKNVEQIEADNLLNNQSIFYNLFFKMNKDIYNKVAELIKKEYNETLNPITQSLIIFYAETKTTIKVEIPKHLKNRFEIINLLKYDYDITSSEYMSEHAFTQNTDIFSYYNNYFAVWDYYYIVTCDENKNDCINMLKKYGINYKELRGICILNEENFDFENTYKLYITKQFENISKEIYDLDKICNKMK